VRSRVDASAHYTFEWTDAGGEGSFAPMACRYLDPSANYPYCSQVMSRTNSGVYAPFWEGRVTFSMRSAGGLEK
jgi:hypothetical protein